jgi:hypothetical protein
VGNSQQVDRPQDRRTDGQSKELAVQMTITAKVAKELRPQELSASGRLDQIPVRGTSGNGSGRSLPDRVVLEQATKGSVGKSDFPLLSFNCCRLAFLFGS